MATTALELNRAPVSIECFQGRVRELTNLIIHDSHRYRRIALGHLGNVVDAEDALQDALLSALTHVGQFRGEAKMSTWLTAIVINAARMKLRQRSCPVQFILDEKNGQQDFRLADMVPDTRPGPAEAYRMRETAAILAQATSRLSPILRRTFQLRDIYGLSIRETAHATGASAGTVKTRLLRARARLREDMRKSLRSRDARNRRPENG